MNSPQESSPSLTLPDVSTLHLGKPNRFQAGFLTKTRTSQLGSGNGSPTPPIFSMNLTSSSDNEDRPTPLRSIPVSRAANILSSPRNGSPKPPTMSSLDENHPPQPSSTATGSASGSGSDSESSTIDPLKLRTALHSAKRRDRLSSMSGSNSSKGKRISSAGSHSGHRASASYSGPLSSSTNGISRHRRGSAERRRSPPIMCSPPSMNDSLVGNRSLTPGQARRMHMGGSVRLDNSSPQRERIDGKPRRITIGSAGMAAANGRVPRPSVVWR
jgi:kinesin family member 18/19